MNFLHEKIKNTSPAGREKLAQLLCPEKRSQRPDNPYIELSSLAQDIHNLYLSLMLDLRRRDVHQMKDLLQTLRDIDPSLAYTAVLASLLTKRKSKSVTNYVRSFARNLPPDSFPFQVNTIHQEQDEGKLGAILQEHPDVSVRLQAVERLGQLGNQTALGMLRREVHGDNAEVVQAIIRKFQEIDPKLALSSAESALFGETPHRDVIASFLGKQGKEGFKILVSTATRGNNEVARSAVLALAHWQPEEIWSWCVEIFKFPTEESCDQAIRVIHLLVENQQLQSGPNTINWRRRAINLFQTLVGYDEGFVRGMSLKALSRLKEPFWRQYAYILLGDIDPRNKILAIELLAEHGQPEDLSRVVPKLNDEFSDVRQAALEAIVQLAPHRKVWYSQVVRATEKKDWALKVAAMQILRKHGDPSDLVHVLPLLNDSDGDVRVHALKTAVHFAPQRAREFALPLVTDEDEDVASTTLEVLKDTDPSIDLVQLAFDKLKKAKGKSGKLLLEVIKKRSPDRLQEAAMVATKSRSWQARQEAAKILTESEDKGSVPALRNLLQDRDDDVSVAAFRGLKQLCPDQIMPLTIEALGHKNWMVKLEGLEVVAADIDSFLVDDVLSLARDEDETVRRAALKVLAKYDDVRVLSELVSSLHDVDEDVRNLAGELMDGKHGSVPVLERDSQAGRGLEKCQRLSTRVEAVNKWASHIARELLGKSICVYQYRQGVGRTTAYRRKQVVEIEVSDTPMTTGHPHAEEIMRGIALHEIGHHLHDIGTRGYSTMRGIAKSEGVREIYDILIDERLERNLRSRRPEWGIYFDRLASYVFSQDVNHIPLEQYATLVNKTPQETLTGIQRGKLPGSLVQTEKTSPSQMVELRDVDVLAIPGAVSPLNAFISCLRCGMDPQIYPNEKLAQAIAEIPDDLKDLSHREILELSRRIADFIGRSDQHQRDLEQLRRTRWKMRDMWRMLSKMLDRLDTTGQLPGWMRAGAPGIRMPRQAFPIPLRRRPGFRRGWKGSGGWSINLGPELKFPTLEKLVEVPFDPSKHQQLIFSIRKHVRRLRPYLAYLGRRTVDEHGSRRGRRLDLAQARKSAVIPNPNVLVMTKEEIQPDAYIGLLIDRSGSMEGQKIDLARRFGALVVESAKGLRGIEGHVNAFDDDTFYLLGDFERNSIASLEATGGNNDAGALERAAQLAFRSRKKNKLLIMISDGSPTECTVTSLKDLVASLTQSGDLVCAQVAVDNVGEIVFPHFIDLSKYEMDEAIARFGRLLMKLTSSWR